MVFKVEKTRELRDAETALIRPQVRPELVTFKLSTLAPRLPDWKLPGIKRLGNDEYLPVGWNA